LTVVGYIFLALNVLLFVVLIVAIFIRGRALFALLVAGLMVATIIRVLGDLFVFLFVVLIVAAIISVFGSIKYKWYLIQVASVFTGITFGISNFLIDIFIILDNPGFTISLSDNEFLVVRDVILFAGLIVAVFITRIPLFFFLVAGLLVAGIYRVLGDLFVFIVIVRGILYAYIILAIIVTVAWRSYDAYYAESMKKRRIESVRKSILNEGRTSESDRSTVKEAIGTYLMKIEELGSVDLSEFCKECKISERQAINLITFAQQHKMIEGYYTKDGKRFLTKKYVHILLKSKLDF